jgi:hypothetical protein
MERHGSAYIANDLGSQPMLHSNLFAWIERHFGAFVKTYKRDYARFVDFPDGATVIILPPT